MAKEWKRLARHNKWVDGCAISESCKIDDSSYRRFVATILGYRNWRIWQGKMDNMEHVVATIMARVVAIRVRIAACDDTVFDELQAW